jgi:alpha-glucosidase
MQSSLIDLELGDGKKLSDNVVIKSTTIKNINEIIVAPVPDKRKNIPDKYTELTIQLKSSFSLIFRVYDDGFAYRISTRFKDSVIIKNETALFKFANGSKIIAPIVQPRDSQDKYHTSFEELYQTKSLDSVNENSLMFSPILVDEKNLKIAVTESDLEDYPGMFLKGSGTFALQSDFAGFPLEEKIVEGDYPESIVARRADYIAKIAGSLIQHRQASCGIADQRETNMTLGHDFLADGSGCDFPILFRVLFHNTVISVVLEQHVRRRVSHLKRRHVRVVRIGEPLALAEF